VRLGGITGTRDDRCQRPSLPVRQYRALTTQVAGPCWATRTAAATGSFDSPGSSRGSYFATTQKTTTAYVDRTVRQPRLRPGFLHRGTSGNADRGSRSATVHGAGVNFRPCTCPYFRPDVPLNFWARRFHRGRVLRSARRNSGFVKHGSRSSPLLPRYRPSTGARFWQCSSHCAARQATSPSGHRPRAFGGWDLQLHCRRSSRCSARCPPRGD